MSENDNYSIAYNLSGDLYKYDNIIASGASDSGSNPDRSAYFNNIF